jgi:hypothetical protein
LVEYAAVPDDPTREVPNPAWAALDAQLRQAHAHRDRLQAEYGLEALTNLEEQRRTMRGFTTAHGKLGQKIWNVWQRVLQLEKRRAAAPRRVPVQAVTQEPVVKLAAINPLCRPAIDFNPRISFQDLFLTQILYRQRPYPPLCRSGANQRKDSNQSDGRKHRNRLIITLPKL